MQQTMQNNGETTVSANKVTAYINSHDVQYLAEDAVFINMGTGEKYTGREAIGGMLHYIYHIAFNATADISSTVITDSYAVVEGTFEGMHTGEFAGMAATGKKVQVPLCVTYDVKDGVIQTGRIYMLGDVLMQQLQS